MRKIIIMVFLLTLLCLTSSANLTEQIDKYIIIRQKLELTAPILSKTDIITLGKLEKNSIEKILNFEIVEILDNYDKRYDIEKFLSLPLIELIEEKAANNETKKIFERANNLKNNIKNNIPEFTFFDAKFTNSKWKKIKLQKENYTQVEEDPEYPIIENEIYIEGETDGDFEVLPVIISFKYERELIEKTIFLEFSHTNEIVNFYRLKIKVTDLYENWTEFSGTEFSENENKNFITYTAISALAPINYPYYDARTMTEGSKSFDRMMKSKGAVSRETPVTFGNEKNLWPGAHKKTVASAGVVRIDVNYGNKNFHSTFVKNTADWVFFTGHGAHRNSSIYTEYYKEGEKAQVLYPPPYTDLVNWNNAETVILFSCDVLDINDYNYLHPDNHAASPGILWANLDTNLLGFNNLAYLIYEDRVVEKLLNHSQVFTRPISAWLENGKENLKNICAIDKENNYYYWHKLNIFNLPVEHWELRVIPEEEWSNYFARNKTKISFDQKLVIKSLEIIENENRDNKFYLHSFKELFDHLRTQQTENSDKVFKNIIAENRSQRQNFFEGLRLYLYRTVSDKNEGYLYEKNLKKSVEYFKKSIKNKDKYEVLSKFMLALAYSRFEPEKQKEIYQKMLTEHPDFKDEIKIALISLEFNRGNYEETINQSINLKKEINEKYVPELEELIEKSKILIKSDFFNGGEK